MTVCGGEGYGRGERWRWGGVGFEGVWGICDIGGGWRIAGMR